MDFSSPTTDIRLQSYLLGEVEFQAALRFQRRLHYEVSGDRSRAILMLCEHPAGISVGRHGSRAHILCEPEELRARRWDVQWVNRGGGTWLHLPGQLAAYAIVPLDRLNLGVGDYVQRLQRVIVAAVTDCGIRGATRTDRPGVFVGPRLLAPVGVAVKDWVSYFGFCINVNSALWLYRAIRSGAGEDGMTSLERERRYRLHPAMIRQLMISHFQAEFGFNQTAVFSSHPALRGSWQRCDENAVTDGRASRIGTVE
jgi:lipoyl(octanoyl) transferase